MKERVGGVRRVIKTIINMDIDVAQGSFSGNKVEYQIMDNCEKSDEFFNWYVTNKPQWFDTPEQAALAWIENYFLWKNKND